MARVRYLLIFYFQFMSAFLLLGIGITFSGLLLLCEHFYFRYFRKYLAHFRNTAWVQLISIDVAESLERMRQINGNSNRRNSNRGDCDRGDNEIEDCANAVDAEIDENDEILPEHGNILTIFYLKKKHFSTKSNWIFLQYYYIVSNLL